MKYFIQFEGNEKLIIKIVLVLLIVVIFLLCVIAFTVVFTERPIYLEMENSLWQELKSSIERRLVQ